MRGHRLVYLAASVILAPLALVAGVVVVGGAATTTGQAANAASSAVCAYANPDPLRIAVAMEQLTREPVDARHWDMYSAAAGIDPAIAFESSSIEQRHQVLLHAVKTILSGTPPHSITTVPMVWWHGRMPADNDDTTWETDTVLGWAGTLADYIDAFVDVYATDPIVLAAGGADGLGCLPPTTSVCSPPTDTDAILATIRALESGDNYTESRHSRASGYARGSGNPSGAYQYIYTAWDGYDEAFQAPPSVQDERANNDVSAVLERFGSVEWVPVAWYVGSGGAAKVRSGEWPLSYIPNPTYNHISIGDYQAKWMQHYTTVELPRAGDPNDELLGAWLAKESVRDVFLTDDPADAALLLDKTIAGCQADDVAEIRSLGDTLKRWRTEIFAHHTTGASNGPTEGLNLLVKEVKRCGRGFENFDHYRLRVLLRAGKPTWPNPPTPPILRTGRPHAHA